MVIIRSRSRSQCRLLFVWLLFARGRARSVACFSCGCYSLAVALASSLKPIACLASAALRLRTRLRCLSSLACLALDCSDARSLACVASGYSAARRLSSLACLLCITSGCSAALRSRVSSVATIFQWLCLVEYRQEVHTFVQARTYAIVHSFVSAFAPALLCPALALASRL